MDINAECLQQLGCDRTCSYTSDRFTAGRTAAAAIVAKTVLGVKRIVCVPGTVIGSNIAVIAGTLVGIKYNE